MFSAGQALIMNNLITGNTTGLNNGTTDAVGGGIASTGFTDPLIYQNLIVNNRADIGGGISFDVPAGFMGPFADQQHDLQ